MQELFDIFKKPHLVLKCVDQIELALPIGNIMLIEFWQKVRFEIYKNFPNEQTNTYQGTGRTIAEAV